jgi:hypothetical protein
MMLISDSVPVVAPKRRFPNPPPDCDPPKEIAMAYLF